eukprot:4736232-Amphidinium_carterae.4
MKELSRSLQQTDNEDLKNLKQLLRTSRAQSTTRRSLHTKCCTMRGTRYKSTLSRLPTVIGQDAILQGKAQVGQSHLAGEHISTAGHSQQSRRSRTLRNATTGQAAIEAQHIKQDRSTGD